MYFIITYVLSVPIIAIDDPIKIFLTVSFFINLFIGLYIADFINQKNKRKK